MWNYNLPVKAAEVLVAGRRFLGEDLDAEVLLRHVLKVDRIGLYTRPERLLSETELASYHNLLVRRAQGEPVAYLTGTREFMGLEFNVSSAVLIPRPETELLVEIVLNTLRPLSGQACIVDVGTGSGAIAVSLAKYLPTAQIYALDISPAALAMAEQNAVQHGVAERVSFQQSNLLSALLTDIAGQVDWIVANLPYIPSADIPQLQLEVVGHEPKLALDGGSDGLVLYRELIPQASQMLKPGGQLIMEMGWDQGRELLSLLDGESWNNAQIIKDYAGLDRFVRANWRTRC